MLEVDGGVRYYTHTRWGRVGAFGQAKTLGPFFEYNSAFAEFGKKFKDKTGLRWENRADPPKKKKYTYIERSYSDSGNEADRDSPESNITSKSQPATPVESKLPIPVQKLMQLIFNRDTFDNTLEAIGYNANKLPLGKLSKTTLKTGFEHLQELSNLITDTNRAQSFHGVSRHEVSSLLVRLPPSKTPLLSQALHHHDCIQQETPLLA